MALETPLQFAEKIADTLKVKMKMVEELFDFDEDKNGYFVAELKPGQFLVKIQFRTLCTLVRELGGEAYVEGAKAWKVPGPLAKAPQASSTPQSTASSIPASVPQTNSAEVLDEDTETLRGSAKKIGHLYPVLTDSFGNIIDGFHRLKADASWPKFKVDRVSGPVELLIARLVANTRRDVPAEEKKEALTQLIKMTGWSPKQLAENLGWNLRTIYRYLPSELKGPEPEELARDRVSRGMEKSVSDTSLKPQDITVGKARELLDTPAGKEVLEQAVKEKLAEGLSVEVGESEDEEPLYAESIKMKEETAEHEIVEQPSEKHSEPSLSSIPKGPCPIQITRVLQCSECHRHFVIEHHPNGKHTLKYVQEVS